MVFVVKITVLSLSPKGAGEASKRRVLDSRAINAGTSLSGKYLYYKKCSPSPEVLSDKILLDGLSVLGELSPII